MTTYSLVTVIPAGLLSLANEVLELLGHGPSCFSVPLRAGNAEATHAAAHWWANGALMEQVTTLPVPAEGWPDGLTDADVQAVRDAMIISDEPLGLRAATEHFVVVCRAQPQALEWSDPAGWFENPVMKGDERQHGGRTWRSLFDNNVWEPSVGWREVVTQGYPEWVQPTGAHDAYGTGNQVSFESADYESVIDANVWSPSAYPAGWTRL